MLLGRRRPRTDTVIVKLSYYPPVPPPSTTDAEVLAMFKTIAHAR